MACDDILKECYVGLLLNSIYAASKTADLHSVAIKRLPQELTAAPQFCLTRADSKTGLCCCKEEEKAKIK